jgi:hypothetical protein
MRVPDVIWLYLRHATPEIERVILEDSLGAAFTLVCADERWFAGGSGREMRNSLQCGQNAGPAMT